MTEIRFYHLTRAPLEQALPQLLEKALEQGRRAVVKSSDAQRLGDLNAQLWTYRDDSFLPHGMAEDGHAKDQPIWLTIADEVPNGADVLILVHGADSALIGDMALVCEMFDDRDPDAVARARARWAAHRDAGHALTYWQQRPEGGWEQKA